MLSTVPLLNFKFKSASIPLGEEELTKALCQIINESINSYPEVTSLTSNLGIR